jgi:Beta-lactamase enzyme family
VLVVVAARSPGPPEPDSVQAAAVVPVSARTATTIAPDAAASPAKAAPRALATGAGIAAARRYARGRKGEVAFAVLDGQGRLRGLNRTVAFPSASVVKAMLLVAVLRKIGSGHLDGGTAKTLTSMITVSDNDAADAIYARVGGAGLRSVAHAAHATRFRDVGYWANAQLTAADQARFFYRVDRLVPPEHRAFARKLLSSIVGYQRWGIPPVAHRHDLKAFFKGGWRTGITHQVALLVKGDRRIALAVLTSGEPSMAYGEQTIAGIAARVLE